MKPWLFHRNSGFWVQIVALTVAGLLLALWPDWGDAPKAQTVLPTLSPTSHHFGTVTVGNTRGPVVFTVNNSLLTNMSIASVQTTAPFSAVNGCPGVLAPGASCTVQVSFTPVSAGSQGGTLSVDWDTVLPPPPPGEVNPSGTLIANLAGVGAGAGTSPLVAVNDAATTARDTAVG
ncbi:MAG: choice-of-anchor D domain-containing protein, partial [Candidatus Competibacter sp.]|nr:choice-of-anchor D domain-containing protein [Candidatus Competibacter sp.]